MAVKFQTYLNLHMIRVFLFLLICAISPNSLSQIYSIPEIEFERKLDTTNVYVDRLKLKQKDALIIKVSIGNLKSDLVTSEFFVFNPDGSIQRFNTVGRYKQLDSKIKKVKVRESQVNKYWDFLRNVHNSQEIYLDQEKLNRNYGSNRVTFEMARSNASTFYSANFTDKVTSGEGQKLMDLISKLLSI